ncbi:MAG: hypothetical protein XU15_C0013G0069 [candidate division NC10 bacterium CSP1-5]|nr:MAG: hypothetical protein XU15_C0013G0069 [candidate division NC10 bacterium CSP1-5]
MDFLTVFYSPVVLLIKRPYLALVPALIVRLAYRASRRRKPAHAALVAAALWALCALYEGYMYFRSKTMIVPIRVGLFSYC